MVILKHLITLQNRSYSTIEKQLNQFITIINNYNEKYNLNQQSILQNQKFYSQLDITILLKIQKIWKYFFKQRISYINHVIKYCFKQKMYYIQIIKELLKIVFSFMPEIKQNNQHKIFPLKKQILEAYHKLIKNSQNTFFLKKNSSQQYNQNQKKNKSQQKNKNKKNINFFKYINFHQKMMKKQMKPSDKDAFQLLIKNNSMFKQSSWMQLISRVNRFTYNQEKYKEKLQKIRQMLLKNKSFEQCQQYLTPKEKFIKNIHNQKHSSQNYLCCSQFFYENQQILPNTTTSQQVQFLGSLLQINQNRLIETVLSMLNTKGGSIFYNTQRELGKQKVKGFQITQQKKESYQQKICSFLENQKVFITPKLKLNKDFKFDWIPILPDPENNYQKSNQYLQGVYVLRIRVFPSQQISLYHQTKKFVVFDEIQNKLIEDFVSYYYVRQNNIIKQLEGHQIVNKMKQKFQFGQNINKVQHSHFFYPISDPEIGNRKFQQSQKSSRTSVKNSSISSKKKEQMFKSLLIFDNTQNKKIEVAQALNKKGYTFSIQSIFGQESFKLLQTTILLNHLEDFDWILSVISNLKGKRIKNFTLLRTFKTLKIQSSLSKEFINFIETKLKERYQDQKIVYHKRKQFAYLQMNTLMGSILVYFLLKEKKDIMVKFERIPEQQENYKQRQNSIKKSAKQEKTTRYSYNTVISQQQFLYKYPNYFQNNWNANSTPNSISFQNHKNVFQYGNQNQNSHNYMMNMPYYYNGQQNYNYSNCNSNYDNYNSAYGYYQNPYYYNQAINGNNYRNQVNKKNNSKGNQNKNNLKYANY